MCTLNRSASRCSAFHCLRDCVEEIARIGALVPALAPWVAAARDHLPADETGDLSTLDMLLSTLSLMVDHLPADVVRWECRAAQIVSDLQGGGADYGQDALTFAAAAAA